MLGGGGVGVPAVPAVSRYVPKSTLAGWQGGHGRSTASKCERCFGPLASVMAFCQPPAPAVRMQADAKGNLPTVAVMS